MQTLSPDYVRDVALEMLDYDPEISEQDIVESIMLDMEMDIRTLVQDVIRNPPASVYDAWAAEYVEEYDPEEDAA